MVEVGQDALSGNQVDEDSLAESARRNDMRAFEQLYRLLSGRIYGLCNIG